MGDTSVDFFLETLKNLTTSSNLEYYIIDDNKRQLQSLAENIKYLRRFLKITEKKRNEHQNVMDLVMQIRHQVSQAENIVEKFVVLAFKANHTTGCHCERQHHIFLNLVSVKKKIKFLRADVERVLNDNMYSTAVDFLLETLKQLIMSSNLIIRDKEVELQSLENIEYLRGFLEITEKDHNEDSEVTKLVMRIGDVVTETEKIVEPFMVLVPEADDHASDPLGKCLDYLSLHIKSVEREIKRLTHEAKQIYEKNMFDLNGVAVKKLEHSSATSGGGSSSLSGRKTPEVLEAKEVIGFEKELKELMTSLQNIHKDGKLQIISITGAGGGGKTTLARKVYDHSCKSREFDICAWVTVSHDYNKTMTRDMLIRILESAIPKYDEDYEKSDEIMLGEKLLKRLKGKKYLIVMDDIWDIKAWNDIRMSFPNEDCKGSKVLFTSRKLVELPDTIRSRHHSLNPLSESESWKLLQKKVFREEACPEDLVGIGMKIAEKCRGLPLGIITTAGILATTKKKLYVWKKLEENLSSIIAKEQDGCMEILELSYKHLPLHLKACFLYIGAHPEDYEIPVRELIWLWIAEGFIQQGEKSLEAIADDYLKELIARYLITIASESNSFGGIKACSIHDLLRELCWEKAKEDNFFLKIYEDGSSATHMDRRLFIGRQFFHKFSKRPHAENLRSFLCLSLPNSSRFEEDLSFFVKNFELLRVFHSIANTSLGKIQKGDLVHLRYLALRLPKGKLYRAPKSFLFLPNLETLNIQVSYWHKIPLPRDIVKMVKLRHLYTKGGIFYYHHSFDEDERNKLDSLQTLHRMCICEQCLRFLNMTPNLRKLGLRGDNVPMLPNLEFLKYLEKLYVHGWVRWDPRRHETITGLKLPPTLTRLTLNYTFLEWDELSTILRTLRNLEVLKLLKNACIGQAWDTEVSPLSNQKEKQVSPLKYLKFHCLDIEEWRSTEDPFRNLEILEIQECEKLKKIPIDFVFLNDLREIKVEWCNKSLEESAAEVRKEQKARIA